MKLLVKADLDGFFGLAIDNVIQLLLIITLCTQVCHFPPELVYARILPAAALSIFFGNIYYAWLAHKKAKEENRTDVCALPYGINTVSLFAYIFFIILPVYQQTQNPQLAWKAGVLACFLSALIEIGGSFIAPWIKKHTPRAALLSTLAGIAITFIAMDFAFKTFATPLITLLPLFIILVTYFSKIRLPFGLPGGLYAIAVGSLLAWCTGFMKAEGIHQAAQALNFYFPSLAIKELFSLIGSPYLLGFLSVIIPMGVFNVVGSLQNIESAEAAGDTFPTKNCLLANGIGSLLAACFGSCFPTTIYIGHPGWKKMGARAGYSVLNGIFILLICFLGATSLIASIMPLEAGIAIVLWIGIIITAQAYQATPTHHAPAVAIGLIPALGAWGLLIVQGAFMASGFSLEKLGSSGMIQSYSLKGMAALNQGFIFISMIWAALSAHLLDEKFKQAALWCLVGAVLSFFGFIHTFHLDKNNILADYGWAVGWEYALPYGLGALLFWGLGRKNRVESLKHQPHSTIEGEAP